MRAPAADWIETAVRPALPVDLDLSLRPLRRGHGDPTTRRDGDGSWWLAVRTPLGPATLRLHATGDEVRVRAWGPGAERAVEAAPGIAGARDSVEGFRPRNGLVRELARRFAGLRLTRLPALFPVLVPSVLEQKVTGIEGRAAYRRICRAWGERAPGPLPLLLPPTPEVLAAKPAYAFHPLGVEMRRAGVIRFAASRAARLEEAAAMPPDRARARLLAFPGVGPWTAAEVALGALADPDAVSVGDFHLPHVVSWALAGEPRGDDARMLELLAPFAGHRGRVIRLLEAAGFHPPAFGPRLAPRDFRRY